MDQYKERRRITERLTREEPPALQFEDVSMFSKGW